MTLRVNGVRLVRAGAHASDDLAAISCSRLYPRRPVSLRVISSVARFKSVRRDTPLNTHLWQLVSPQFAKYGASTQPAALLQRGSHLRGQLQQLADRGSRAATLLAALPIERRAMTGLMMLEEDRDASPPACYARSPQAQN